jgi:DNA-binding ferritin-like protein
MIHLLCYGEGRVTAVVDDPQNAETAQLLEQISSALEDATYHLSAPLEAA